MNNKLINHKNIVLSIICFTEKHSEKKNRNFFYFRSDPDPDPLFPEVDPDPQQNEVDPKQRSTCYCSYIYIL